MAQEVFLPNSNGEAGAQRAAEELSQLQEAIRRILAIHGRWLSEDEAHGLINRVLQPIAHRPDAISRDTSPDSDGSGRRRARRR